MASVKIDIPAEALTVFGETPDERSRFAREATASEAYRQTRFSSADAQVFLGLKLDGFKEFLKKRYLPTQKQERRGVLLAPSSPTRPLQPDWPVSPITVSIPDALAAKLGDSPEECSRFVLDAVVIEAYRRALLTRHELAALLDIGVMDFDEFRLERKIPNNCSVGRFLKGYHDGLKVLVPE